MYYSWTPPRATPYSKHQNFPSQSALVETSGKRPPLVSDREYFFWCDGL